MTRKTDDQEVAVEVASPIQPPLGEFLTTDDVILPASELHGVGEPEVVPDTPPIQETAEAPEPPEGYVAVVYVGLADLIELGDLKFRPGQPVYVPSDQVDELLTWPNEPFALVAPAPADEE